MQISLKGIARIQCYTGLAWVASCLLLPDMMHGLCGSMAGLVPGAATTTVLLKVQSAIIFSYASLFAAVAQFKDESSQKKALQYSMGGGICAIVVYLWKGMGFLPDADLYMGIAMNLVLSIILPSVAVYSWHKSVPKPDPSEETPLKKAIRVVYWELFIWGLTYVGCPWITGDALLPGFPSGAPIEFFVCMMGSILVGMAMLLMGVAQCDNQAQEKVVSYVMIPFFLGWFYLMSLLAPYILNSPNGAKKVYAALAFFALNIFYLVYERYPEAKRKTLLRVSYLFYGYWAYEFIFFPELAAALLQIRVTGAEHLIGWLMSVIALTFAAFSQNDGDSQGRLMHYSMYAYGLVLYMVGYLELDFGLLAHASFFFYCANGLMLYSDVYDSSSLSSMFSKFWKSGASKAAAAKSTRSRSKTPGKKMK